jgi:hypothetical protein
MHPGQHHIPNRLIPLHAQPLLHVFCRNSFGSGHHQEHAVIPSVKRQFAVHHDGATPDGRFCTAIHAFPPINRAQPTQSLRRALSAHKPVLLSHFFHVVNACRFIWKLFKEVFCCHNHHIFSKPQAPLRNLFMFYIQTDIHYKEIKLIFLLRQPSLRAYSNYWHLLRTGRATHSFEDTIRYNPYTIINRSLYKEQIEDYYSFIPKSRIKVIIFENLVNDMENTLREICTFLNIKFEEFPKNVLNTHSNKARVPRNEILQIRRNLLLRNFGNSRYNNRLPFKPSKEENPIPLYAKLLNRLHSKINPHLPISPPKINQQTKLFLDEYFYRELLGIDELINQNALSQWFPDLHN